MGECQIAGPCTSQNTGTSTLNCSKNLNKCSEKDFNNKTIITTSTIIKQLSSLINDCDISDILFELSIICIFIGIFLAELISWKTALFIYFIIRLISNDFARHAISTLPRDLRGIMLVVFIKWEMRLRLRQNKPLHEHFEKIVNKRPNDECLVEVESGRKMTFLEFDQHSNKFANFFQKCHIGFENGEVISLFMENGIDFFAAWFGLSKIGIITAWINTNLKLEPLSHSIRVANCRAILTTRTLFPVLENALKKALLPHDITIFVSEHGLLVEYKWVREECFIREHPIDKIEKPEIPSNLNFQSILCYIYTSGTTGIPKAALIRHFRFYLMASSSGRVFQITPSDRLYLTLPMYHSQGGILGIGQVLIKGASACIRSRFSASNFWKDCNRFECTISQYIGEICRYLLLQPSIPEERTHKVRLMYGNGLRPQIWEQFVSRFGIKQIGEVYGSTEGNSNLINIDNKLGACGFIPIYMSLLSGIYPIRLLRVDEKGELLRNENGFCVRCKPGESGEIVASINPNNPILRFEGYVDRLATKHKLVENCEHKGETVFASGDILYWDNYGYLYFKDRRGDTYRWKGENVSTTEVEGLLQRSTEQQVIIDLTVYGVEVPGCEGRAGMVAVVLQEGTDIEEFINKMAVIFTEQLASYAIPVFVRICDEIEKTGTFKLKKEHLQIEEGGHEKYRYNTDADENAFRQESYFFWTFGVHEPGCYGAIDLGSGKSFLFPPKLAPEYAIWDGKIQNEQWFLDKYKVDQVVFHENGLKIIETLNAFSPIEKIFLLKAENTDSGIVLEPPTKVPGIDKFEIDTKILYPIVAELRVFKTDLEIEVLKYASKCANEAHKELMRKVKPNMFEYQMESLFRHISYYAGGCRHLGYTCIAATGCNAAILHYGK
ncbi:hypothetical protein Mgra_00009166 [Meloidogyne graminicola]|uniref:Very long-chain fatty acid transport protein n=1 Tax=Meloidogyne graminicola TaxID=189291 RepID=A0A8S9ZDQ5_9BILA|nr:hypothetical protein Mgra_00009166 [Meloidogyne graminicola]